jgi:hypothetical protein
MFKALTIAVVAAVVVWLVAGSTASSGIASLIGGQSVIPKVNFDRAVPDQPAVEARAAPSAQEVAPTVASLEVPATKSDFRRSKVDFEQAFADVNLPRCDNTPTNREKLRAAGWKRLAASR